MNDEPLWDPDVQRLARSVEENLSVHPDPESLVAHHRGELPAPEADALEEHLAWCRDCASLYQELPHFLEGEVEPFDPRERHEDWQALEARRARAPAGREEASSRETRPTARARLAAGLAAAFALALAGAALWIGQLSERLEDSGRPRANVPIYDLAPPATERTREVRPLSIELHRDAVLILNTPDELEDRLYRARIVDREGRSRWTVEGLEPTAFGNLTLQLPRGSLEPGVYTVTVETAAGESLASYPVRVVEPPPEGPARPAGPTG